MVQRELAALPRDRKSMYGFQAPYGRACKQGGMPACHNPAGSISAANLLTNTHLINYPGDPMAACDALRHTVLTA